MKKFKLGFTLSEVATALTIVGIVAAIVMPQLVKNIERAKTGAVLGRAVEQLELGCQNMVEVANSIVDDGVYFTSLKGMTYKDIGYDTSDDTEILKNNEKFMDAALPYFNLYKSDLATDDFDDPDKVPPIKEFDDNQSVNTLYKLYITEGYKANFKTLPASISVHGVSSLDNEAAKEVMIDTNGWTKKPNRFGRDIYLFSWQFNYEDSCKLKPARYDNGIARYTREVVENGFKIKHF